MSSQPHLQAVGSPFTGHADAPPTPASPVSGSTTAGDPPKNTTKPAATKQRAEQALPTDRLSFDKQVQALRSLAQLSGNGRRPVTAEEQSSALGLKGNVGGLSNRFFKDCGWVETSGRGMYVPTETLVKFHRHLGIQPDDLVGARTILAETAVHSWFWHEIGASLEGDGIRQSGVLHLLGNAAGAAPSHTPQLNLIIDWLIWLGLVVREGDMLKLTTPTSAAASDAEEEPTEQPVAEQTVDDATVIVDEVPVSAPSDDHATPTVDTAALLSFNFSVRITADDAAKLSNDQLDRLLEFAEKLRG